MADANTESHNPYWPLLTADEVIKLTESGRDVARQLRSIVSLLSNSTTNRGLIQVIERETVERGKLEVLMKLQIETAKLQIASTDRLSDVVGKLTLAIETATALRQT